MNQASFKGHFSAGSINEQVQLLGRSWKNLACFEGLPWQPIDTANIFRVPLLRSSPGRPHQIALLPDQAVSMKAV